MNLWRVSVDERSGSPLNATEPVTTGASVAVVYPALSQDGKRIAYHGFISNRQHYENFARAPDSG